MLPASSIAAGLDRIDWSRPWLAPLREAAFDCLAEDDWRLACNKAAAAAGLGNHHGHRLQFVPQAWLPPGIAYESHISATGCVPTRDNLHDFFNALIWLSYPQAKAALNAIQAGEIARNAVAVPTAAAGQGSTRGKARDRATIFDENAALLLTCGRQADAIEQALRAHRWHAALMNGRADFGSSCEVRLFGHALIEKLVDPYKAITAHVWTLAMPTGFFEMRAEAQRREIDTALSAALARGLLQAPATPLPVLGVPGWFEPQDAAFYADVSVFRPKKSP